MPPQPRTIGIDLGTTNSVAARNGRALALPRDEGVDFVLPSVVAYPPNGTTLVGREARGRRPIDPKNTLVSSKRLIGVRWTSWYANQYREHYPYDFARTADDSVSFQTRAGIISPIDVGATIVQRLNQGSLVEPRTTDAVVTVPAGFDDTRRHATYEAVSRTGFLSVSLIEEPVATALAYLDRSNLRRAAVYDLGGGTFDIAIVDCEQYPFTVLADRGDPYLGGDDVDRKIALEIAERTLADTGWDLTANTEVFTRLLMAAERAKCQLSTSTAATIDLSEVDEAAPDSCQTAVITRNELQDLSTSLIRRTFALCDEALAAAKLRTEGIDAVFLAGGSTLLPGLREAVRSYFGKQPRFDLDPMHVVGIGASLAAARPGVSGLLEAGPQV